MKPPPWAAFRCAWLPRFARDDTALWGRRLGYKQSGIGRDRSLHAFDTFSQVKTTWIQLV
jgi:hypothetical protein